MLECTLAAVVVFNLARWCACIRNCRRWRDFFEKKESEFEALTVEKSPNPSSPCPLLLRKLWTIHFEDAPFAQSSKPFSNTLLSKARSFMRHVVPYEVADWLARLGAGLLIPDSDVIEVGIFVEICFISTLLENSSVVADSCYAIALTHVTDTWLPFIRSHAFACWPLH